MLSIHVNIAGYFGGRTFDQKFLLDLPKELMIKEVFPYINQYLGSGIFSEACVEEGKFVCMHNDEIVDLDYLTTKVMDQDTITFMEPIAGG